MKYRFTLRTPDEKIATSFDLELPQGVAMQLHEALSGTWTVEVIWILEQYRPLDWNFWKEDEGGK